MGVTDLFNVRVVAFSRRDYPGSTPLTDEQKTVLNSGTDEEKTVFLKERGLEVSAFVKGFDELDKDKPILPIKGATGGFALLGWSLGTSFALAAIANLDSLDPDVQKWWGEHLRALILYGTIFFSSYWSKSLSPLVRQSPLPVSRTHGPNMSSSCQWTSPFLRYGTTTRDCCFKEHRLRQH